MLERRGDLGLRGLKAAAGADHRGRAATGARRLESLPPSLRPPSPTSLLAMPEIGPTLREARMRARIDVSEIEAKTKIRAKYLRALENEEWGLLPGPTFVKSFLRTYAQALDLDGKALVEEYRRSTSTRARRCSSRSSRRLRAGAHAQADVRPGGRSGSGEPLAGIRDHGRLDRGGDRGADRAARRRRKSNTNTPGTSGATTTPVRTTRQARTSTPAPATAPSRPTRSWRCR